MANNSLESNPFASLFPSIEAAQKFVRCQNSEAPEEEFPNLNNSSLGCVIIVMHIQYLSDLHVSQ